MQCLFLALLPCCLRSWPEQPLHPSSPLHHSTERVFPCPGDTKSVGAQTLQLGHCDMLAQRHRLARGVGWVPEGNQGRAHSTPSNKLSSSKKWTQVSHSQLIEPFGNQVACVSFCPGQYMESGGGAPRAGVGRESQRSVRWALVMASSREPSRILSRSPSWVFIPYYVKWKPVASSSELFGGLAARSST